MFSEAALGQGQGVTFGRRAGDTEPIVVRCNKVDPDTGVVTAQDLTGMFSVAFHIRHRDTGAIQVFTGARFAVTTALAGECTYYPLAGDLVQGEYDAFVLVTDGAGKTATFPSDTNNTIDVVGTF